ncbi:hypothetical protein KA977_05515 [Candidatus Dependentiae bacterium]|nr:hypothetical protein [Candidatus Dependentiae bacterium]
MIYSLFFLIFISISFFSISKILFKRFIFESLIDDYIFHSAIGFTIIYYITIVFGFSGLLVKQFFIGLFSFQILFTVLNINNLASLIQFIIRRQNIIVLKILTGLIILNLLLHLPGALAPVASLDGLTYHLPLPKIYLAEQQIIPVDYLFYSFFPQFAEMFFMYGLYFENPVFSQLFHWYFYFLTLLVIYRFSKVFIKSEVFCLIAVLFFCSAPAINRLAGYTKNEFFLIFYSILSIYSFYKYFTEKKCCWLFFTLMFCAVSNNIKYHGIINSAIMIIIIFIHFIMTRHYSYLKNILAFLFIFIILSCPFYLRNYIYIGNPVYPFLNNIFGIKQTQFNNIPQIREIETNTNNMVRHFKETKMKSNPLINFIKFPYQVSIKFQTYDFWKYSLSPLFYIFYCSIFAMAFFIDRTELRKLVYIFVYAVLFIILIYFNAPRSRYILPAYPVLCVAGTYFFYRLFLMGSCWKIFSIANILLFFVVILINYPLLAGQHISRYKVITGIEPEDKYLEKRFYADGEFYQAVKWTNENIDSSKKFFIVHQQTFYFNREFLLGYSPSLTLSPVNINNVKNHEDFILKMKENRISYIFFSEKYAKRFSYNITDLIKQLESENKIFPVKKFSGNVIYSVSPEI